MTLKYAFLAFTIKADQHFYNAIHRENVFTSTFFCIFCIYDVMMIGYLKYSMTDVVYRYYVYILTRWAQILRVYRSFDIHSV